MKTAILTFSLAAACALSLLNSAQAQEGRAEGQPGARPEGERGERGGARRDPLMTALDANGDGVIDAKEISEAPAALKKLDKNGDGKLTQEELRPNMPGRERAGQGGANPDEMVNRLMQFDKNGDGKLSKDELPERMQSMMERGDADQDGFLNKDEIRKLSQPRGNEGPARGRGEGREREND